MKKSLKIIIVTILVVLNVNSYASHEKTALHNIVHELTSLEKMIKLAKTSANPDQRIQFDYLSLERDIDKVKQGIEDYINTVRRDPRQLPEIDGNYKH